MSEQQSGSNRPQSGGGNNNNRRHHHNRNRRPQGQGGQPGQNAQGGNPGGNQGGQGQNQNRQHPNQNRPQQGQQARPQGQQQGQQGGGQGGGQRRRHRGGQNRNRSHGQGQGQGHQPGQHGQQQHHPHGINLERLYEKYLNLLDQHLIARRKYHDMFYRAEPSQKAKLERNFYNTLNDVREFENKMTPEARELFEKRNNGLRPDTIYTTNHQIVEPEEKVVVSEEEIEDPHFLQSQRAADYSGDTEESVGTLDDYLKYKNLV